MEYIQIVKHLKGLNGINKSGFTTELVIKW